MTVAELRRRLIEPDVPRDLAEVVSNLIDHVWRLEQTLDLINSATKSAVRGAPDSFVHAPGKAWQP